MTDTLNPPTLTTTERNRVAKARQRAYAAAHRADDTQQAPTRQERRYAARRQATAEQQAEREATVLERATALPARRRERKERKRAEALRRATDRARELGRRA